MSQTLKHRWNQGLASDIFFWRDNHGTEVDLLFEHGGALHAVEIKSGATFTPDWLRGLGRWRRYAGNDAAAPVLVHGGRDSFVVGGVHVLAWSALGV